MLASLALPVALAAVRTHSAYTLGTWSATHPGSWPDRTACADVPVVLDAFGPAPCPPPAATSYTLELARDTLPACAGTDAVDVAVDPDILPPDLGNTLRAARLATDVSLEWAAEPLARSYVLHRSVVKEGWPAPPLRPGLVAPAAREPDVSGPDPLYFYRAAGASCSGREGP